MFIYNVFALLQFLVNNTIQKSTGTNNSLMFRCWAEKKKKTKRYLIHKDDLHYLKLVICNHSN